MASARPTNATRTFCCRRSRPLRPMPGGSISPRSKARSAGCSRCSRTSRRSSRPTASTPFTPLLVSEQCSYGGRFFGRAYDPSQLLGDSCWMVLGEAALRHPDTDQAAHPRAALRLRGSRRDLQHRCRRSARRSSRAAPRPASARASAWEDTYTRGPLGREGGRRPAPRRLARLRHPRREVLTETMMRCASAISS